MRRKRKETQSLEAARRAKRPGRQTRQDDKESTPPRRPGPESDPRVEQIERR